MMFIAPFLMCFLYIVSLAPNAIYYLKVISHAIVHYRNHNRLYTVPQERVQVAPKQGGAAAVSSTVEH